MDASDIGMPMELKEAMEEDLQKRLKWIVGKRNTWWTRIRIHFVVMKWEKKWGKMWRINKARNS